MCKKGTKAITRKYNNFEQPLFTKIMFSKFKVDQKFIGVEQCVIRNKKSFG